MTIDWRGGIRAAQKDFAETINNPSIWFRLGWLDLKRQYRRTFLGPLWLTLSTAIFIGAFGLVWAQIFNNPIKEYLPKVSVGFVVFNLISQFVIDGSKSFIVSSSVILQTRTPKLAILLRQASFFLFMFAHHLCVVLLVVVIFVPLRDVRFFEASSGLMLVILNCVLCQTWIATLCARFRDLPLVFANIMQVLFFVSPVLWAISDIGGLTAELMKLNPVAVAIEIVRHPALGQDADLSLWLRSFWYTLINAGIAIAVFTRFRGRIAYWV